MSSDHPTFPNPTIREAVCELHFALPVKEMWDAKRFHDFFQRIQSEFPLFSPVAESGLQIQLRSGSLNVAPQRNRMRYQHMSRPLFMQLSSDILTVNTLEPYPGWRQVYKDILQSWQWASDVLNPAGISRIGLRYINFIPKTAAEETPGVWLANNPYVAEAVLSSGAGFLSRAEVRHSVSHRTICTIAETTEDEQVYLILDIDCIEESTSETYLDLSKSLPHLHNTTWQIFESFITPKLRSLLGGTQ